MYTDRSVNLMSKPFVKCMQDIIGAMKSTYKADSFALVPGSGTYGMECVARQFGQDKKCLVIRNGYFSYRWSDIFNVCHIPSEEVVLKAAPVETGPNPHFAPMDVEKIVAKIKEMKPGLVCAPHVETSTGIILPDAFISKITAAVHEYGGIFCLDAIAAGTIWADMKKCDIDVVISAPQKGWSGPASCALLMLSNRAVKKMKTDPPKSTSFCCNLAKWTEVADIYESGNFKYYTTLPTDALMIFRDVITELQAHGVEQAKKDLITLGTRVRASLAKRGFKSVAAKEYAAPGVVVVYGPHKDMVARLIAQGIQVAGGVPFKLGEPEGLITFRVGLFGLDKIKNIDRTVALLEEAIDKAMGVRSNL